MTSTVGILLAATLAGCAQPGDPGGGDDGDDVLQLRMGTLMPLTGALNNLGPSMQNGAKLAIEDVNAANKGVRITAIHEDDRTTDTAAITTTFNQLVAQGVTVIAGPCCSGITGSILDLAIQNQVVVASPSATSPTLTERENQGYFWRVVPTDEGQGKVLANLVAEEGVMTVNMIVVNNDYGAGFATVFQDHFQTSLSGVVARVERYPEGSTEVSSQVTAACTGAGTAIQGIVLVAYTDEAAAILRAMQAQDCLDKVEVFSAEGAYAPGATETTFVGRAGRDSDGNWLGVGIKGTTPQAPGDRWTSLYNAKYDSDPEQYAAESYDAVVFLALAALKAQSTAGREIRQHLVDIANAPGTKCNTFAACADLIADGQEIDYVGMAHDLEYDADRREPKSGAYSLWEVQEDGRMVITRENVVAE